MPCDKAIDQSEQSIEQDPLHLYLDAK